MSTPSVRHANDPLLVALGGAIRVLRKERGLSQEALAHTCGIERSYMSGIERGQQNLTAIALGRIAEGIGVTLEQLMREARL